MEIFRAYTLDLYEFCVKVSTRLQWYKSQAGRRRFECPINLLFMCTVTNAQHPDTVGIWLFDEGKRDTANANPKRKHTAKAYGKVEWAPDKIGQAGKCKPGNYFVADNTEALDLSTFTITVWVKFSKDTDGAEQNIVHKQEGKDRSTRSYTIKIWEGMAFCIFASTSDDDAVKLSY